MCSYFKDGNNMKDAWKHIGHCYILLLVKMAVIAWSLFHLATNYARMMSINTLQ